jgi:hypothetical protein
MLAYVTQPLCWVAGGPDTHGGRLAKRASGRGREVKVFIGGLLGALIGLLIRGLWRSIRMNDDAWTRKYRWCSFKILPNWLCRISGSWTALICPLYNLHVPSHPIPDIWGRLFNRCHSMRARSLHFLLHLHQLPMEIVSWTVVLAYIQF